MDDCAAPHHKKIARCRAFFAPEAISFNGVALTNTIYNFAQKLRTANDDVYAERVVMLIDENATSQSEGTVLFFQAVPSDIIFGSPSMAGANGDVTMVLPGNITVSFSGYCRPSCRRTTTAKNRNPAALRGRADDLRTRRRQKEILEAAVNFLKANR